MKMDEMIDYIPKASQQIPSNDEKFLFFFDPKLMDEKKFLFGLSLKTGVQIFSAVLLIQAISTFFDIFNPGSFLMFFVNIIGCGVFLIAAVYAFLSTMNNNYNYARVAYIITSILFIFYAVYYVCKSIIKIIEFITPWDGDFLQLDFLQYVFGYGVLLFIILYLIYVLYHYMLEVRDGSGSPINLVNEEDDLLVNEPMKKSE